jgi:FkbM family methyltransferase
MYSQSGEDSIIETFFGTDYCGTCVEVGAATGITGSNTYKFEQNGWDVLCIEPNPELYNVCSQHRKNAINCAVGSKERDDATFTVFCVGEGNQEAISSLVVDQRLIETHKHLIKGVKKITVPVKRLDTILKENNFLSKIDFISIDTEGTELDVLRSLDFVKHDPTLFVIENNFNDTLIEDFLKEKGYKKTLRNNVNDFYIKE